MPPLLLPLQESQGFLVPRSGGGGKGGGKEVGIRLSAQALPAEREMRGVSGDGVEGEEGKKFNADIWREGGLFKRKGTGEKDVRIRKGPRDPLSGKISFFSRALFSSFRDFKAA